MRNGEETIYRSCLYTIPEGFCGNVNAQSDLQISITRVAVTVEYFADTREGGRRNGELSLSVSVELRWVTGQDPYRGP